MHSVQTNTSHRRRIWSSSRYECLTLPIRPVLTRWTIQFDVNDYPSARNTAVYFEMMLRLLFSLPSRPEIIVLGSFSPLWALVEGYATSDLLHLGPAVYYDVPYIR